MLFWSGHGLREQSKPKFKVGQYVVKVPSKKIPSSFDNKVGQVTHMYHRKEIGWMYEVVFFGQPYCPLTDGGWKMYEWELVILE